MNGVVFKVPKDRAMNGDIVKTPIKDSVPINSIRCQNVTIRRKNKKKELKEKIVDEGEKELLLEA